MTSHEATFMEQRRQRYCVAPLESLYTEFCASATNLFQTQFSEV